jgi:hypothetical protein
MVGKAVCGVGTWRAFFQGRVRVRVMRCRPRPLGRAACCTRQKRRGALRLYVGLAGVLI